jgi:nucleoporin p58/p45
MPTFLNIAEGSQEYAAIAQGITSLQASLQQLRDRFLGEEEDLRKVAEIWETFKSVDGRPGAVRVAAHRDFPQE